MIARMDTRTAEPSILEQLRRQERLLVLLSAANRAGLTPIPVLQLHTLAYFTNVLAAVWDLPALEGKLLKRRGGPFYPALQADLDRLVGMGLVNISGFTHVLDDGRGWRLEGAFRLNTIVANPLLAQALSTPAQSQLQGFIQEVAYAVSALSEGDFARAPSEDATYSDPLVDVGSVVDFGEWQSMNYSARAAAVFRHLLGDSYTRRNAPPVCAAPAHQDASQCHPIALSISGLGHLRI
jgi:hypothetical protein